MPCAMTCGREFSLKSLVLHPADNPSLITRSYSIVALMRSRKSILRKPLGPTLAGVARS
jgi:hypothetical protein